jgi:toxin-antitoxin system PIN domain toxin
VILLDVNVLVDAFRGDQPRHRAVRAWLDGVAGGDGAFGIPEPALSGFVRVVTHPRVFNEPDDIEDALAFAERLRELPHALTVRPGERHWSIFTRLCRLTRAVGNAVPDAYLAALAIESGSEMITADRGFARFPGLRWYDPAESPET